VFVFLGYWFSLVGVFRSTDTKLARIFESGRGEAPFSIAKDVVSLTEVVVCKCRLEMMVAVDLPNSEQPVK
jgi:hypothetical protein